MNNRLTLNLGLRFDRYRVFLPEQAHPAGRFNSTLQTFPAVDNLIDWNVLAPRIGLIHDFAGDGKTIAKLSYGQYWLRPGTGLDFNANPNSNQWWRRYTWSDPDGSGVWEPGEEGDLQGSRGGVALESVDPGLELPFVREVAAWIERELVANIGLRTGVVWRGERQHSMRRNANRAVRRVHGAGFYFRSGAGRASRHGRRWARDSGLPPQARACGSGARQHRPQCARRRQPLLDVGDHGKQAPDRSVVAGGRIRAHLEPRPGERILRAARPPKHVSADAERPDQRWHGWAVRVPDLVGQDSRHVRRSVGRTDHPVSAPSVRAALRAHVRDA